MTDLLERSARFIDDDTYEGPRSINPVDGQLNEVGDGIAMVTAFSHVVALSTDDGLLLFDTSGGPFGDAVVEALDAWADDPVHTVVYTHGHLDHVGGGGAIRDRTVERGAPPPHVVGHARVPVRFDRYHLTAGWNATINARQFGGRRVRIADAWTVDWVRPDTVVEDRLDLGVGGLRVELRHALGETDDHLWAWLPERRILCTGDFLIWVFPNAGNPQKVQRYPSEWAAALREMAALEPELLCPAHGLPIAGTDRIQRVLGETATVLEDLVSQTLALMNDGAGLDTILHTVRPPEGLMDRPYLRPTYDEPEFVVRNIWRLYGGWYDGNPANLKPAPEDVVAVELARLAGGSAALALRAQEVADAGDLRLACHLVELAARATPTSTEIHAARAEIYRRRRDEETSLMSKGVFGEAAERSAAIATEGEEPSESP